MLSQLLTSFCRNLNPIYLSKVLTLLDRADSSESEGGNEPVLNNGLSGFGEMIVKEMNRLGMMVDISHVSSNTMRDALKVTRSPLIFSHSSARNVTNVSRNVPDDVLEQVVSKKTNQKNITFADLSLHFFLHLIFLTRKIFQVLSRDDLTYFRSTGVRGYDEISTI